MNEREGEDLDYILQAISNRTRRRILKLLAEEAPLTYTKIMQKLDIKDSGTLGFHLKKMSKLLRRDEFGEYRLSDLGWKALKIMKELEQKEGDITVEEAPETEEEEKKIRVFSDHLKFEYTYNLAKRLKEEGSKAVLTDIMTLVIHPMDRELFNETVESISDILTCYVPEELYDDLILKSNEIFRIQRYRKGDEDVKSKKSVIVVKGEEIHGGWIDALVTGLVTTITSSVSSLVSFFTGDRMVKKVKTKRNIYLTENIEGDFNNVRIELVGGYLKVEKGEGKIVAWETESGKPDVKYEIKNGTLRIYCSAGYIEVGIPDRSYRQLSLEISGGVLNTSGIKSREIHLEIDGGLANLNTELDDDGSIKLSISGGMTKVFAKAPEGFKLIDFSIHGGYMDIKLESKVVPIDVEVDRQNGWIDITLFGKKVGFLHRTGSDRKITGDISGGYGKIVVTKI